MVKKQHWLPGKDKKKYDKNSKIETHMTKKIKNLKAESSKIPKVSKSHIRDKNLVISVKNQEKIIKDVIKKHGPIIDLEKDPQLLIDILVKFKPQFYGPDGGLPPGGVPDPPPPPGPSSYRGIENVHLMKEILKLNKKMSSIKKRLK